MKFTAFSWDFMLYVFSNGIYVPATIQVLQSRTPVWDFNTMLFSGCNITKPQHWKYVNRSETNSTDIVV